MKQFYFLVIVFVCISVTVIGQVSINTDGTQPDPSAILDAKSTTRGFLPPRMTHVELNAIVNPANGLVVFCTDCGPDGSGALAMSMAGAWYLLSSNCMNPVSPVSGNHVALPTQIEWKWNPVVNAQGYKWNIINEYASAEDMGASTSKTETGLTCMTPYTRYVWVYSACGISAATTLSQSTSGVFTSAPVPGVHTPSLTQIIWNWNTVVGATGYRWSSVNDFATAVDMGLSLMAIETGLTCNTIYTRYVWAYSECGNSTGTMLTQVTSGSSVNAPTAGTNVPAPTQIIWNWNTVADATGYKWNTINDYATATDLGLNLSKTETGLACNAPYTRYIWAYGACGNSTPTTLSQTTSSNPDAPTAGTHVPSEAQIAWNWNTVPGATGYKWSITNNYADATDLGTATTKIETGLTCNTPHTRYVWAYNTCDNSNALTLNQSTSSCAFTCGTPFTINHVAGTVAPVTKTVNYGTVTNIPGELTKCWITSNLGSDHQAPAVSDATEASAGWYWQFNRKQGYKHDGTTRTPNTTWISSINETSNWITANDPCNIELGTSWRIPTYTEWYNVDNIGGWTTSTGPWSSGLKLHAAGLLYYPNGSLYNRGSNGYYWSSSQTDATYGWSLTFVMGCIMYSDNKAQGFSVRCLKDEGNATIIPTVTTSPVTNITQTTAASGGNVTSDGGATVTARGICWSTTANPTTAGSHTTDGSGTGTFVSNLTGLTANTVYYAKAYAINSVGTAYGDEVSFTTSSAVFSCGSSFTINHVAGIVAPVTKTVTYGSVTNIPGATTKCWITSNLGADHQATAVNDATEASGGWYWQFNRKRGFKHDGTTRTPNTTWIVSINENLDWQTVNDPCNIELGTGWRIPTNSEWTNVDVSGGWIDWTGPWASGLKLHAAGFLYNPGLLYSRGSYGYYWSSTQIDANNGGSLHFDNGQSLTLGNYKVNCFPLRCLKDEGAP